MSTSLRDDPGVPIMVVENVEKTFRPKQTLGNKLKLAPAAEIHAVAGVSLRIQSGELLGLIGESGSGKTTLARLLMRLDTSDSGTILFLGERDLADLHGPELRAFYRNVQMIFQDPFESINPRFTVYETVIEPLRAQRIGKHADRLSMIERAMERAGLGPAAKYYARYPHELSGGERQRLSIARALVLEPRLIIADEPVSMLDVSIRAGILNLLKELSIKDGLTVLYISHDLSTTRYLCDRIVIMYRGKIVEIGTTEQVLENPMHPYARMLRAAVPNADPDASRPRLSESGGDDAVPPGVKACQFAAECPHAFADCRSRAPSLIEHAPGHWVACHMYQSGAMA